MKREDFERLGDKHKSYEARTETTLMPGCPVIIRLDGRAFHTFTRGLKRPYDERMSCAMIQTTKDLVAQTNANIGYVQSDEITLIFKNSDHLVPFMFSGRVQKIVSVVASTASVMFNRIILETIPERAKMMPVFDARVFQYPDENLAVETLMWRETDATRNSLSMAVQSLYTHTECMGAGFVKKHEMLHTKGVNWNNYPAFFKRGTYVQRQMALKDLTEEELMKIPERHRPTGPVLRSTVQELDLPPYTQIMNPVDVFLNRQPVIRTGVLCGQE